MFTKLTDVRVILTIGFCYSNNGKSLSGVDNGYLRIYGSVSSFPLEPICIVCVKEIQKRKSHFL